VVCNQHLHAECGGAATISLEVTTEIYQIQPISDFILSQDTLFDCKFIKHILFFHAIFVHYMLNMLQETFFSSLELFL
jgi:hypothetical protein